MLNEQVSTVPSSSSTATGYSGGPALMESDGSWELEIFLSLAHPSSGIRGADTHRVGDSQGSDPGSPLCESEQKRREREREKQSTLTK